MCSNILAADSTIQSNFTCENGSYDVQHLEYFDGTNYTVNVNKDDTFSLLDNDPRNKNRPRFEPLKKNSSHYCVSTTYYK